MRALTLLVMLLALSPSLSAQVIGNDPDPIPAGKIRLTFTYVGPNSGLHFNAAGKPEVALGSNSNIQTLGLTFGLTDDVELRVSTGQGILSRESGDRFEDPTWGAGADDSQIRLRWRFVHEDGLAIALLSATTIPTGQISNEDHLGIGQGFVSQTETVVARQDFDRVHLWTEAFLSLPIGRYHQDTSIRWGTNLALGYDINEVVQPTVELTFLNVQPGNVEALDGAIGLTFVPNEHILIQLGVQHTLAGVNTDKATTPVASFSYTF